MDKTKIVKLIEKNLSTREIASALGVSQTTINYWLKKYDLKTTKTLRRRKSMVWSKLNDSEFVALVESSPSIAHCLRVIGVTADTRNYRPFRARCKELGVNITRAKNGNATKVILVKNSTSSRGTVRNRVLRESLLPYNCQICGMGPKWRGRDLKLTLDHINGESTDHRIENLRFLCPNCDSQQPTYCYNKHLSRIGVSSKG